MSMATVRVQQVDPNAVMHDDDLDVAGEYDVSLSEDVGPGQAADVALDVFHSNVAIKTLDDFVITVLFEGKEVEGDPEHESYSYSHLGSM